MLLHTKRERIDPFPERTPDHVIDGFAKRVVDIVRFAHTAGEVTLAPESREVWQELYNDLTTWDHGHTINSLMARSEMYCLMLAMIFALMAKRNQITVPDLQAAYAWILYWKHTLIYIFDGERAKVEAEQQADFAETVYQAIASINGGDGCTQTEINKNFKGNRLTNEITPALEILLNTTPPRITVHTIKTGKRGRSPKVYAISQ